MRGRYGNDRLNIFIAFVLIGFGVISLFYQPLVMRIIQLLLFGVFIFRFLSRDFYRRRKENDKFLSITAPIKGFFQSRYKRYKDKGNRYFSCPKCSATLRVPKGRGRITVTCPACRHKFDKRT